MPFEMKSKDPHFNEGYKHQRAGEYRGIRSGRPDSYHEGAAQAHNMGHTRERAAYAAEDEILNKRYGSGHDMTVHGEGKPHGSK